MLCQTENGSAKSFSESSGYVGSYWSFDSQRWSCIHKTGL